MSIRAQAFTKTILFTDIVDSTATLEQIGDEEWQRVAGVHRRLLQDTVNHDGGEVVKWLGDGIMATFGSVADAVHCAIAIQRSAGFVAGRKLGVRVGVEVGEIALDDDDYVGGAIVVAERLCKEAAGGQILSSSLVARLLQRRRDFQFRSIGSLNLKGIGDPVDSVEVIYGGASGQTLLTGSPFVGRDRELQRLRRRLEAAERGYGGLVLVAGEPGIGKTRTVHEVSRVVSERGGLVLWGHCFEGDWAPAYGPFVEVLNACARSIPAEELMALLGTGSSPLSRLAPLMREHLPDLLEPPRLQPDEERFRLLDAVTQFFSALASRQRVLLLVLDDLHWADRGTIVMLRHLAKFSTDVGLLIVGMYRDVELDREHPLAQALGGLYRETSFERLDLCGLETEEVGQLLAHLGQEQPPEELAATLRAETGGNPFFLREILLHLTTDGALHDDHGRWLVDAVTAAQLPESVRHTLARRVERLSPAANGLLRAASGFDGPFDVTIAVRIAGLEEPDGFDALDEALAAGLVQPIGETFDFSHALVRQTVYEQLTSPRRARLHRQIAEALEAAHAGRLDEYAPALAYQYSRSASRPGAERGAEHAIRAAVQAESVYAWDAVAAFLRSALNLMTAADTRRRQVLERLALALAWALEFDEAVQVAAEAAEIALSADGRRAAADYLAMAAGTLARAGHLPGAWKLAERGLELCPTEHDLTWAQLRAYDLQRREAQDPLSPGIPLDTAERREVSHILFEARAADRGWLASIGFACFNSRADVLGQEDPLTLTVWAGEFRKARDLWRARADRAESRGQVARSVSAWAHLARCHTALGEFEQARAAYARGETLVKRLPAGTTQALNLAAVRAELTFAQAQGWDELVADIFGPIIQQAITERNWILGVSRAVCASACAWLGQREPAFRHLQMLLDPLNRAPGWAPNYAIIACLAADVLWQLERPRHLATIERNLLAKVVAPDFRTPMLDGRLAVARLCALDGRDEEATAWFKRARETLREQGARPLLAIVDFDEGLAFLRRGDDGDSARAAPLLEAARQQFASLDMKGWLARCEHLLSLRSE